MGAARVRKRRVAYGAGGLQSAAGRAGSRRRSPPRILPDTPALAAGKLGISGAADLRTGKSEYYSCTTRGIFGKAHGGFFFRRASTAAGGVSLLERKGLEKELC